MNATRDRHKEMLKVLADGIIPADARDEGAGAVNAGPRLAEKIESGVNQRLYVDGIETAQTFARKNFQRGLIELTSTEVHEVLRLLQKERPLFFKQLRMDVAALYLSDPDVWQRIGFPGPSIASGGYPDFESAQTSTIHELKERSLP